MFSTLIITLLFTVPLFTGAVLIVNFCRKRGLRRAPNGFSCSCRKGGCAPRPVKSGSGYFAHKR